MLRGSPALNERSKPSEKAQLNLNFRVREVRQLAISNDSAKIWLVYGRVGAPVPRQIQAMR